MPLWMTFGFLLAGAINVGCVLLFTRGFTSNAVGEVFPEVFAPFGMVGIILWGLAYIAMARRAHRAPAIVIVFAIEKLVYSVTWFIFLTRHNLADLWQGDFSVALFYTIYGPNDALFYVFFAWCWWRLKSQPFV